MTKYSSRKPVWVALSDSIDSGLSLFQRLWEVWYYFVAVVIGVFMVLWGIFFNGWDWLLIGAGLATILLAGWYAYQVLNRNDSG